MTPPGRRGGSGESAVRGPRSGHPLAVQQALVARVLAEANPPSVVSKHALQARWTSVIVLPTDADIADKTA